ncbi:MULTISPECIES: DUF2442 domain-containing protein [Photorhabdus]|uniref:DUF2442 domain-containing protein n=1 Tax=Photorhabdus thracensis TaxID=230089 RepID=A0A0F7LU92_9GAMM|nr:DUF2442 domain-containing protein [Photorhabdus thracensis]AKH65387.1 hypothetical protein VY86_20515 [Photorhabdus thracensis]MCC8420195.1 DUF2442 domain-containing protein [Photorhabdus thracensis]
MRRVINVQTKPEYILVLTFDDGTQGEISIADRLFSSMFEPLKDPQFFAQAKVDKFGAVCWPNEADLASDVLYRKVISQ